MAAKLSPASHFQGTATFRFVQDDDHNAGLTMILTPLAGSHILPSS
jgi:hypothetical protein